MKVININLHIYGIPVKGTLTIDDTMTKGVQKTIFDEIRAADGYEKRELLNHESRQTVARGIKERICATDGCFKKIYAKGLCQKHYVSDLKSRKGGE